MTLSLDFAFEGFRIVREKPRLILLWGLLFIFGNGLATCVLIAMAGPALENLSHFTNASDSKTAMALLGQVLPAYAVVFPVSLVVQSVFTCAVYRSSFGLKNTHLAYLRFGGDEMRQIVVTLAFTVMALAIYMGCAALAAMVSVAFASASPAAGTAGLALGLLLAGCLFTWITSRLSLCSVQSFDQKTFNLFGSWVLTKGQGWPLIGGYLVTLIMMAFVFILCLGIFGALAMLCNGGDLTTVTSLMSPDMTSLQAYIKPLTVVYLLVMNGLILPLVTAILIGAQASAYRELNGTSLRMKTEDVF
jgi:hypothetical protein